MRNVIPYRKAILTDECPNKSVHHQYGKQYPAYPRYRKEKGKYEKIRLAVISTGLAWERLHWPAISELKEHYGRHYAIGQKAMQNGLQPPWVWITATFMTIMRYAATGRY